MKTTPDDYAKFFKHILTEASNNSSITELIFIPNIKIKSKAQFGFNAWNETYENNDIELSYGFGWGLLQSPHGYGTFKEGSDRG